MPIINHIVPRHAGWEMRDRGHDVVVWFENARAANRMINWINKNIEYPVLFAHMTSDQSDRVAVQFWFDSDLQRVLVSKMAGL